MINYDIKRQIFCEFYCQLVKDLPPTMTSVIIAQPIQNLKSRIHPEPFTGLSSVVRLYHNSREGCKDSNLKGGGEMTHPSFIIIKYNGAIYCHSKLLPKLTKTTLNLYLYSIAITIAEEMHAAPTRGKHSFTIRRIKVGVSRVDQSPTQICTTVTDRGRRVPHQPDLEITALKAS